MAGDDDKTKTVETPPLSPKKLGKSDGSSGSGEAVRVVREIIGAAPNWPKLLEICPRANWI
jgi:hypothetical protein